MSIQRTDSHSAIKLLERSGLLGGHNQFAVHTRTQPRPIEFGTEVVPKTTDLSALIANRKTSIISDDNNIRCGAEDLGLRLSEASLFKLFDSFLTRVHSKVAVISAFEPRLSRRKVRLEEVGFTVIAEPARRVARKVKADMDSVFGAVAAKAVTRDRVSQLALITGDGDMVSLIKYLRRLYQVPGTKLQVVVFGVPGTMGYLLKETADAVVPLGRDVLINAARTSPAGTSTPDRHRCSAWPRT